METSTIKYGQEYGSNLIKIAKRLCENQRLCKYLINSGLDPLNEKIYPERINGLSLLHKNIRVIPLISPEDQTTNSKIVIFYNSGEINANPDIELLDLMINIYCPFKEWTITGDTLRPFGIMNEIRKSIQDRRINGLGEIIYKGFSLTSITDEMGVYSMRFYINAFS